MWAFGGSGELALLEFAAEGLAYDELELGFEGSEPRRENDALVIGRWVVVLQQVGNHLGIIARSLHPQSLRSRVNTLSIRRTEGVHGAYQLS